MNKKVKKKKYSGLSFIELIIAVGVAGIALVVLMNMASSSMKEAIRYERQDALNRLAMDGALVVRRQAENANDPNRDGITQSEVIFVADEGYCYEIDFGEENEEPEIVFTSTPEYPYNEDNLSNLETVESFREDVIYNVESDLGDLYYVAYCIDAISTSSDLHTYIGAVVAGYVECGNCGVEPYKHNIIVSIRRDFSEPED